MTHEKASQIFATARNPERGKPLQNNTRLFQRGNNFAIRLHDTDVVTIHTDGTYTLNNGGWQTVTTKDRINEYSPARLYQNKGLWYIGSVLFEEGMKIDANGVPTGLHPDPKETEKKKRKLDRMVSEYVKGFQAYIDTSGLPMPNAGDCFYCQMMETKSKKPLGDAIENTSHLLMHIEESYYMGSLLWNAIREKGYQSPNVIWHMIETDKTNMASIILRSYFSKRKPQLLKLL